MKGEYNNGNPDANGRAPERIVSSTTVNGRVIYIQYTPSIVRKTTTSGIISLSLLLQITSVFAMFALPVPFSVAGVVFLFAVTTSLIAFPFWSWTFFGREFVEINENRIIVIRFSWLKKTEPRVVELDEHTNLLLNMQDTWSWRTLREKGVFRVSNESQSIDFGIKLNEKDFEKLLLLLNRAMRTYKELAMQHKHESAVMHTETAPPLDKQQDGRAVQSLHEYFKQYAPSDKNASSFIVEPAVKVGSR